MFFKLYFNLLFLSAMEFVRGFQLKVFLTLMRKYRLVINNLLEELNHISKILKVM